jgi:hypothetical protein
MSRHSSTTKANYLIVKYTFLKRHEIITNSWSWTKLQNNKVDLHKRSNKSKIWFNTMYKCGILWQEYKNMWSQ